MYYNKLNNKDFLRFLQTLFSLSLYSIVSLATRPALR